VPPRRLAALSEVHPGRPAGEPEAPDRKAGVPSHYAPYTAQSAAHGGPVHRRTSGVKASKGPTSVAMVSVPPSLLSARSPELLVSG
jgi:hypothetical protein